MMKRPEVKLLGSWEETERKAVWGDVIETFDEWPASSKLMSKLAKRARKVGLLTLAEKIDRAVLAENEAVKLCSVLDRAEVEADKRMKALARMLDVYEEGLR